MRIFDAELHARQLLSFHPPPTRLNSNCVRFDWSDDPVRQGALAAAATWLKLAPPPVSGSSADFSPFDFDFDGFVCRFLAVIGRLTRGGAC